jgi:hypothetical protein
LKERYGDWVEPSISRVRIVQQSEDVFLEVTYNDSQDIKLKRLNLNFIADGDDDDTGKLMFLPEFNAQHNAEMFFDKLDLYSIEMTGVGELLFSKEGDNAAAKYSGAEKGKPNGNITKR